MVLADWCYRGVTRFEGAVFRVGVTLLPVFDVSLVLSVSQCLCVFTLTVRGAMTMVEYEKLRSSPAGSYRCDASLECFRFLTFFFLI